MTGTIKRYSLAVAAAVMAVGLAGGVYAAGQDNSSGQDRGGRPGRFGGPGGPMGRGGPMGPGGPEGMLGMMALGRLDLTDAQKDAVKGILDSHKDEIKALGDRARTAHLALEAAVTGTTFDEAAVRTKAADVAAVDADAAVARAKGFNEVFQILTSDQQTKLKAMQANMEKRMAAGRPPRRGGPGGR
jgi:periplasmic protein CpxP/Spy